jgi:hypothetical protein
MAMVDVHHTDGRTVFRAMSRGTMIKLFKADPETIDEARAERVWVRWHPQDEWAPVRLFAMKKHSASFVVKVEPAEAQAFLDSRPAEELPTRAKGAGQ